MILDLTCSDSYLPLYPWGSCPSPPTTEPQIWVWPGHFSPSGLTPRQAPQAAGSRLARPWAHLLQTDLVLGLDELLLSLATLAESRRLHPAQLLHHAQ